MKTTWNRREFIGTGLAVGALALSSGSLLGACSGIQRADLPDGNDAQTRATGLDPEAVDILRYAALAPSGHNSQPWTVTVNAPRS